MTVPRTVAHAAKAQSKKKRSISEVIVMPEGMYFLTRVNCSLNAFPGMHPQNKELFNQMKYKSVIFQEGFSGQNWHI